MSLEYTYGVAVAAGTVGVPGSLLAAPPLIFESTAEQIHPVRDFDLPLLPDFFDHSGNCLDGYIGAMTIIAAGALIEKYVPENKRTAVIIGTSVTAATLSSAANVAYEAGVYIPPTPQKSPDAPFDAPDAIYGSVTGILFSAAFCYAALRHKAKLRSSKQNAVD